MEEEVEEEGEVVVDNRESCWQLPGQQLGAPAVGQRAQEAVAMAIVCRFDVVATERWLEMG